MNQSTRWSSILGLAGLVAMLVGAIRRRRERPPLPVSAQATLRAESGPSGFA